jgi:hypothetical protein
MLVDVLRASPDREIELAPSRTAMPVRAIKL